MNRRRKVNKYKDRRIFSRTASRTHRRNIYSSSPTNMRGGHRIQGDTQADLNEDRQETLLLIPINFNKMKYAMLQAVNRLPEARVN